MAFYCCKEHQANHWKSGHKVECFPEDANRMGVPSLSCILTGEVEPQELLQSAAASLMGEPGVALYLGVSKSNPKEKMILTDIWSRLDNTEIALSAPPGLYLPPISPAAFCSAEDRYIADNKQVVTDEACVRLCRIYDEDHTMGGDETLFWNKLTSDNFRLCVETLFDEVSVQQRHQAIQYLSQQIILANWSAHIEHPDSLQQAQANSLIGKVLRLEGGIEMVYISSPIPCFAKLTNDELDWFNGANSKGCCHASPIIKAPVVAYRCVEEGWIVVRLNCRMHFGPFPIIDQAKSLTLFEKDAIFLKIFVAAAAFGDVTAIQAELYLAKSFAILEKYEEVFTKAAYKLLSMLLEIHPQPRRANSYFLYDIASGHGSRAATMLRRKQDSAARDELLLAARSYYDAALCTHQFYPNRFIRGKRYIGLAATLKRLGYPELAKRGFLWAFSDPSGWMSPTEPGSCNLAITNNLDALWEMIQMSEHERKREINRDVKGIREVSKRIEKQAQDPSRSHYVVLCRGCQKKLQFTQHKYDVCSRCKEPYCSRKCQSKDWQFHKLNCRKVEDETKSAVYAFEKYGNCTKSSNDLIASANLTNAKHSMTLADGAKRSADWLRFRTG